MLINQAAPGFVTFDYDNHETLIGDRDLINDLEKEYRYLNDNNWFNWFNRYG